MGVKNNTEGGEIVQVQGGHIIRATGCKDRHSKVFTAKGPRDRRVRLAAHTAIQFYDVQDRLGYDRPSKAVDWLMNKAKASIDKLAELPPWDPTTVVSNNSKNVVGVNEEMSLGGGGNKEGYVPQYDSMRSFFPTSNTSEGNSGNISFQNYPQDLCLSLHSLHDPGAGVSGDHQIHPGHDQGIFHGGFDVGWGNQQDVGRFSRLMGLDGSGSGAGSSGEGKGGIMFNNSASFMSTMSNYSQNQRGTLQSNYSPFGRSFVENQQINNNGNINNNQHLISGIGYGSGSGSDHNNLMGFYIPSQIHGDVHVHGASSLSNNRASSSSLSPDSTPH